MNLFTLTPEQVLDKNFIKIIHGTAGIAKSSKTINFLLFYSVCFLWTTSTNKLKRDAIDRYGVNAATTCSALFLNHDGRFYQDYKEPEGVDTVIIDEVLQTHPRVIDWAIEHVGKYNIIIMTDRKQMLVKQKKHDRQLLKAFEDLRQSPIVIEYEGRETLRARDTETKNEIERLYTVNSNGSDEFVKALQSHRHPVITYDQLGFCTKDVYITHTNASEDKLYKDHHLSTGVYNTDDLIPKGSIANKAPVDGTNYPILSQLQAEKSSVRGYYQLSNIGSATRYQGSEVTTDQKLYYIITPDAVVSNREWYTVVSRCWSLSSIIIVVDIERKQRLTTFRGKTIKDTKTLILTGVEI